MSEFDSELGVQATVVRQNGCTFGILSWNKKGPDSKWFILPMTLGLSVPDLFDHGAEVESRSGRDAGPEGDDYVYADSGFVTKRNGQVTTVGHFRTLRTGYRMCLMFAGGPPTAIDDAKCAAWINAIRTGRDAHDSDARDLIARLHLGE
jgi:hypothetical protein